VSSPPSRLELEPKKKTVRAGQNVDLECKVPDSANQAEITYVILIHLPYGFKAFVQVLELMGSLYNASKMLTAFHSPQMV